MGKFDGILIASDMDGTLLNDERTIGAETIEALEYFTANGGHFSLATGRTRPGTAAYRRILPCNGPGVYLNGAIICDETTEQIVYMEGLDDRAKELARKVMQRFPHIGIEVFLLDKSYVCNMCDVTRQHFVNLDIPYILCGLDDIAEPTSEWGKINFTGEHEQVEEVKQFVDYMQDRWGRVPTDTELRKIANVIVWNLWQMDGMTGTVPFGKPKEQYHQYSLFDFVVVDEANDVEKQPDMECRIYDWRSDRSLTYRSIKEGY